MGKEIKSHLVQKAYLENFYRTQNLFYISENNKIESRNVKSTFVKTNHFYEDPIKNELLESKLNLNAEQQGMEVIWKISNSKNTFTLSKEEEFNLRKYCLSSLLRVNYVEQDEEEFEFNIHRVPALERILDYNFKENLLVLSDEKTLDDSVNFNSYLLWFFKYTRIQFFKLDTEVDFLCPASMCMKSIYNEDVLKKIDRKFFNQDSVLVQFFINSNTVVSFTSLLLFPEDLMSPIGLNDFELGALDFPNHIYYDFEFSEPIDKEGNTKFNIRKINESESLWFKAPLLWHIRSEPVAFNYINNFLKYVNELLGAYYKLESIRNEFREKNLVITYNDLPNKLIKYLPAHELINIKKEEKGFTNLSRLNKIKELLEEYISK